MEHLDHDGIFMTLMEIEMTSHTDNEDNADHLLELGLIETVY